MTINRTAISLILAAAALGGCGNARDLSGGMRGAGVRSRSAATRSASGTSTALTIEQASEKLDLGKDVKGVRARLERIVKDPTTTGDDHDRAALALSRAYEAEGDHEHAVRTVEDLLAAHVDDHRWALAHAASKQLRLLLTGKDQEQPSFNPDRVVSPFARALTHYFPIGADKQLTVNILLFGGDDATSNKLGTFAIGDAARQMRLERCPLCKDDLDSSIHIGRSDSWVGIPAYRGRLDGALDVFYFDLGSDRIPTRYQKYLPLDEKTIVSHLENGDGLIAAKERKDAPPAILIAAPRRAELADVEEALSKQTSLPTTPVVVKVSSAPRPGEIRGVVRASFAGYKSCYEKLLQSAPQATGRVMLKFTIGADGSVTNSSIDASRTTLVGDAFDACTLDVTKKLRFPASGHGETTVDYPITFSPDGAKTP